MTPLARTCSPSRARCGASKAPTSFPPALGAEFARLILVTDNGPLATDLQASVEDIQSVTRAQEVVFRRPGSNGITIAQVSEQVGVGIVE